MNDLQDLVDDWHRKTFGPDVDMNRLVAKLSEEVHEFLCAYLTGTPLPDQAAELADINICLLAIAGRLETDLERHVNYKLSELIERGSSQVQRDLERGIPAPLFSKEVRTDAV